MSQTPPQKSLLLPIAMMVLCGLFLFYKYVLQIYPSVITHELMKEFQLSGEGLGNLAAMFYYSYLVTQFFVGVLLDKFSTRWLSTAAMLFCAIGVYFFAQAQTLLAAELCRILMGVGVAFATVGYLKVASVWFSPRYYAFFSGLLISACMAGAFVGQAVLSIVVTDLGWRASLSWIGVLGFALTILFALVLRDRTAFNESVRDVKPTVGWKEVAAILKRPVNWLLTAYNGLTFAPVAVFGGLWGNPFLQEAYHISRAQAGMLVSYVFIGLAIGGPLLGVLAKYFGGPKKTMFYFNFVAAAACLVAIYGEGLPYWAIATCLFVFGFAVGAFMLCFVLGKELNMLLLTATVMSMINMSDALFDGVTEPMIGKFLDMGWDGKLVDGVRYFSLSNYQHALWVLPIYLVLAAILLIWVREPVKK